MDISLSQNVVHHLAENITSQIRLMEAALIKLNFLSQTEELPIDLSMAKDAIRDLPLGFIKEEVKIDNILASVAEAFKIDVDQLKGESQANHISLARHTAMHLCRKLIPDIPMSYIATTLGRNDHTTVMYADKKILRLIEKDFSFKEKVDQIKKKLS